MEMGERKMEYIRLFWEHDLADEPTSMLYEVDTQNDRLAARSIDIFRDGNILRFPICMPVRSRSRRYRQWKNLVPICTEKNFGHSRSQRKNLRRYGTHKVNV